MTDQEREPASSGTPAWKSPVTLSILLHVLILVVALSSWSWNNSVKEPPPRSISARLVSNQPPQPEPAATPLKPDPAKEKARQQAEEKQQLEEKRKAEEKARKAREEAARQEKEKQRKQAEAEKEQARKAEQARQKAKEAARQKAEAQAKAQAKQKAEEERKRKEAERKAAEERRKQEEAERQRKEKAAEAKRKAEEEKRREAERKLKEQQLEALAESASKSREAEQRRQAKEAAAAKARQAQMMSESEKFQALIRDRLSRAWYPPSSATSEMTATLEITLLPTGELVSVRLINSSGNTAFDNSALSAVRGLNRFPVPDDQATFERYFRQFSIEFNPERLK